MGLFDMLTGKKEFGNINPDDPASVQAAFTAHMQAQMQGDAAVQAFYTQYGLKGEEHWEEVEAKLHARGMAIDGLRGAANNMTAQAYQQAGMAAPDQVEGFSLQQYALLVAARERAGGDPTRLDQVLAGFGCDEARFARMEAEWNRRMDASNPANAVQAAQLLGQYHMHLATARSGG